MEEPTLRLIIVAFLISALMPWFLDFRKRLFENVTAPFF
jgi:hypothetical protein